MGTKVIPNRNRIPNHHKWDLTPLFANEDQWSELYSSVEKDFEKYNKFKGHLHESTKLLKEFIDFHLLIHRRIDRLFTYAQLRSDQDKSNQFYLGLLQRANHLVTRATEVASFLRPEILEFQDDIIQKFIESIQLRPFRFYLEKILRHRPHTLGQSEEKLLAMSREVTQAPYQVFSQLDNVDLKFGTILDENGQEKELSHGNFITFLTSSDRRVRRQAFDQYYTTYDDHKNTLATSLAFSIKKDLFISRARQFRNSLSASLFVENIPEAVYDNLVKTVRTHLQPLYLYLGLRQHVLGLPELHFYDTYVPIIKDVNYHMTYEEAVEVGVKALAPLGKAYTNELRDGLSNGWVDRYENRGKRSGAYSSGCYDSPPYILMNYEDNSINSLYTLIHEAGHSMHSLYSRKHQPYVDHEYSIFVAEVASTFNEILLSRYLLNHFDGNPLMQAYILNREIDNIRATLYRQTMFAEFEKSVHQRIDENQSLTLADFMSTYGELLQVYFGKAMIIDPQLELECLRIPHFYSAFYVYKYATGISAAIALAQKVTGDDESACESYLNFLKLGGSQFPLDALRCAGVNVQSPEPVILACRYFVDLVDRLNSVI
jgi:oligoendopeptidase F